MRKAVNILGLVFIALGICVFSYPKAVNYYNEKNTEVNIEKFEETVLTQTEEKNPLLERLREEIEAYNLSLFENGQEISDPFFYEGESVDLTEYGFENNMFGYIEIPSIDIKLGIYLGATYENMNLGAVHLDNTSMPVGGNNTNCVIAAHRGAGRFGDMFRNINKIQVGDGVKIVNPWEELEYTVTEIFAIDPGDIDKILIRENKDMLTLVSCHPYGSSKYRYIVYCERAGEVQ
ncbi:MAG: class C sortase [Clostridiales bacterium]|nr:class C sortase [Clostridiales bacterium]